MNIEITLDREEFEREMKAVVADSSRESLFLLLGFPVTVRKEADQLRLGPVPLAAFAHDMVTGLYQILLEGGPKEYKYRDFYGGLTVKLAQSGNLFLIENPDTGESIRCSREEALSAFCTFGEDVLKLITENRPRVAGLELVQKAVTRLKSLRT